MTPETAHKKIEVYVATHDGRLPIETEISLRHIAQSLQNMIDSSSSFNIELERFVQTLVHKVPDLSATQGFSSLIEKEQQKYLF